MILSCFPETVFLLIPSALSPLSSWETVSAHPKFPHNFPPEVKTKAKAAYNITHYLTLVSPKETSTTIKPHLWLKEPALRSSFILWIWAKFLQISAIHKSPNQSSPTLREERTGLEILGHGGSLPSGASSGVKYSVLSPNRDSLERGPCVLPSDSITTRPWPWLIQMLPY